MRVAAWANESLRGVGRPAQTYTLQTATNPLASAGFGWTTLTNVTLDANGAFEVPYDPSNAFRLYRMRK